MPIRPHLWWDLLPHQQTINNMRIARANTASSLSNTATSDKFHLGTTTTSGNTNGNNNNNNNSEVSALLVVTVAIGTVLMAALLVCYICVFRQLCCQLPRESTAGAAPDGADGKGGGRKHNKKKKKKKNRKQEVDGDDDEGRVEQDVPLTDMTQVSDTERV